MERLPPSQFDLDSAGILVANFLQSWWQAGFALPAATPNQQTCHELQNPNPSPREDGLRLPAPVDDGPSLSSPGEHPAPVCPEGPGAGAGVATVPDPSAGCRPRPVGHSDEHPSGLQDPGRRCVPGESGGGLRLGSFAAITLVQRLASLAGDLLLNRDPHRRCRRLLRSSRFQRSTPARAQRHDVTSRTAFYPRAPPGRQTQQGSAWRTPFPTAGGPYLW